MVDVGPVVTREHSSVGADDDDLLVFVERLAAAGQGDPATARAREEIRRAIHAGSPPPGLRRLAEALAASAAETPPPRHPVDDVTSVVPAMQAHTLVELTDADPAEVGAVITALIADGRRVVVTAETDVELGVVRGEVAAGRVLDGLPALPAADLRELRRLLATATATARMRPGQQLPPHEAMPTVEDVERLCAQAGQAQAVDGTSMVPHMLGSVDPDRRAAVTTIARCVTTRLEALGSRREHAWEWELLGHLVHTRHRAAFDRVSEDTAQSVAIVEKRRTAPPVTLTGPLPADAADQLIDYHSFLQAGGRSRAYFRPTVQREAQAVLRLIRVGDRQPESSADVLRVLDHLELGERLHRIEAGCQEMRIPGPRGPAELAELAEGLGRVAAAARVVGQLRHDVLFLATDSPLSVPDVRSAAEVAAAILDYAEHGSAAEAAGHLDGIAVGLAALAPAAATAPEHQRAVDALRARDVARYAVAVGELGAARREQRDAARCAELVGGLRATAPTLADAWEQAPEHGSAALGFASFIPADELLSAVPPPDSADVVVVVGAAQLGVERLLLAAVAPRMIATVGPDDEPEESPSLLSVLHRCAALVIRGQAAGKRAPGRVVQLSSARAVASAVGQVGA